MEQKTQGKSKPNVGYTLLVLMLTTIIVTSLSITYYAWSKYQTTGESDKATAQVAKWHFELRAEETKTSPAEPFVMARTDEYGHVIVEKLAPGTYGDIPIFVDMTGTEVLTRLNINITITDCPRNIEFYETQADRTNNKPINLQQTVDGNGKNVTTITVEKYYTIEDENAEDYAGKVHDETIYWNWPYEKSNAGNSTIESDDIDTEDSGKEAQIVITVTATEILEKPRYLADMVKSGEVEIGDIVKYDPLKGMSDTDIATEGIGTYTAKMTSTDAEANTSENNPTTGYSSDQPFNVNTDKITTWRVLGINDNGEVELMGITPNTISFTGQAAYNNGIKIMNNIASIYGHGAGATGARSMKLEDVDQYTSFDKTTYSSYGSSYGDTKQYTFDNTSSYTGIKAGVEFTIEDTNGNLIQDTNGRTNLTKDSVATVQQTMYGYGITSNKKAEIPDKVYTMLTANNYWLASLNCNFEQSFCALGFQIVSLGSIRSFGVFYSNGGARIGEYAVAPVVSLRSNIQISGGDANGWELDV